MRPREELKRELATQWLATADKDFDLAQHLVSEGCVYCEAIGFNSQQAAEKLLKAFLAMYQVDFPKTHNLYGVEYRYPGDFPELTSQDAETAFHLGSLPVRAGAARPRPCRTESDILVQDMRHLRWPAALAGALMILAGCARNMTYEERSRDLLARVDRSVAKGPFKDSWNSLASYKVPQWYQDGKFGIFIHWGVYSVPAYGNEWYPRNMYLADNPVSQYHVKTYGPQNKFGYKDFIPRFTAEKFDPDQWAQLFRRAGAKFVVPVAEHHDGFQMYDSSLNDWNAMQMGPKRDVLGLLAGAIRRHGMIFGASSHRAEHWWFFEGGMQFPSDVKEPRYVGLYGPALPRKTGFGDESQPNQAYLDDWLARTAEIVEKYRPQIIWFDWWIEQPVFEPYRQKFAAYYYNRTAEWNRQAVINYKLNAFPENAAVLDVERGQLDSIRPQFWQTDTSISKKSWGYIKDDEFKTADSIIDDLADIVSKNGALLLNIGPRADGTIPEQAEKILLEIGRWLDVNGEAIYGTRPWKTFGEGPTQVVAGSFKDTERGAFTSADFRFTTKGDTLYAIALALPQDGKLIVKSLAENSPYWTKPLGRIELLGSKVALKWARTAEGLSVELPPERPSDNALVLKITPAGSTAR